MGKPQNTPDVDDDSAPPPAYQETPPFNPNFAQQGSSTTYQSPPFNPNYNNNQHYHSPPHTPDINQQHQQQSQSLYPQIPISPPPTQTQHVYQPQQQQARYQTIELPYPSTTPNVTDRMRRRQIEERRKFPLAAIFFLFGWFCPPLWVIGACCCAGSRNEYESFWGKVNFIMAMAMIISSVIYSIFAMSQYMS